MILFFLIAFSSSATNLLLIGQSLKPFSLSIDRNSPRIQLPLPVLSFAHMWFKPWWNHSYKKLRYRQGTARCVVSVEILPIATQQCRNYLYDKSWTNQSYEVGWLRWADV